MKFSSHLTLGTFGNAGGSFGGARGIGAAALSFVVRSVMLRALSLSLLRQRYSYCERSESS